MNEWMKERDLLIEETLAFAQGVAANAPKLASPARQFETAQSFASSSLQSADVVASVRRDAPDLERAAILRRVANFKAHQQRFQREREDYFQKTMAKARPEHGIVQNVDKPHNPTRSIPDYRRPATTVDH
jgi:hypothetical protein